MEKFFNHKEREQQILDKWYRENIYLFDKSDSNTFYIDTPPPTVSGLLHMGHVFSFVQTDIIARYKRMKGFNVFYPIGFDDNGLPTERLVEKVTGKKVGKNCTKEEFVEVCKNIVFDCELEFEKLFKKIALSVDWNLKYQTISDKTKILSQNHFRKFVDKGLIYKKNAPVYWDCEDKTALAQADIEDKEIEGVKTHIFFTLEDGMKQEVMTTRPELLPACVALLFHPSKNLKGSYAFVPFFGYKVRLIADETVDPDKGTGVVMCCSYGDFCDVEWIRKHGLKSNPIISDYGTILHDYAKIEEGKFLKVNDARKKIIELLTESGDIKFHESFFHPVKCGERSGKPIEILEKEQWYIKILEYKDLLLAEAEKLDFYPSYMKVRLVQWIEGLNQDWCISRDRYFGVEIPDGLSSHVLDTWFTSALTPSISFGCEPCLTPVFDLRPQAHEIIRTWTFYTLCSYVLGEKKLPWKNVMLSGWCLALDGAKMSKSKGNVVTPIALLEEYGTDVVRYWCSGTALGADVSYNPKFLDVGRKFVTKLWNVAKFCLIEWNHELTDADLSDIKVENKIDLWILSQMGDVILEYQKHLDCFEYYKARVVLDNFFWFDFCDNYIEIIKVRYYAKDKSCLFALRLVFEAILKLYAPFVPYITDELFCIMFGFDSVHKKGSFPSSSKYSKLSDKKGVDNFLSCLEIVRKYKSENGLPMNAKIDGSVFSFEIDPDLRSDFANVSGIVF